MPFAIFWRSDLTGSFWTIQGEKIKLQILQCLRPFTNPPFYTSISIFYVLTAKIFWQSFSFLVVRVYVVCHCFYNDGGRASSSPSYGTQPLHWYQKQIRPKGGKKSLKVQQKKVPKRVDFSSTIRTRRDIQCLPYAGFFGWLPSYSCWIFVVSTNWNQFEGLIFRSNLMKLSVATQDYVIFLSSNFLEILGRPKCTFSSPRTFKLSSGEPKVIPLVAWYHGLFLVPWTTHLLFKTVNKLLGCL